MATVSSLPHRTVYSSEVQHRIFHLAQDICTLLGYKAYVSISESRGNHTQETVSSWTDESMAHEDMVYGMDEYNPYFSWIQQARALAADFSRPESWTYVARRVVTSGLPAKKQVAKCWLRQRSLTVACVGSDIELDTAIAAVLASNVELKMRIISVDSLESDGICEMVFAVEVPRHFIGILHYSLTSQAQSLYNEDSELSFKISGEKVVVIRAEAFS